MCLHTCTACVQVELRKREQQLERQSERLNVSQRVIAEQEEELAEVTKELEETERENTRLRHSMEKMLEETNYSRQAAHHTLFLCLTCQRLFITTFVNNGNNGGVSGSLDQNKYFKHEVCVCVVRCASCSSDTSGLRSLNSLLSKENQILCTTPVT